MNTMAPSRGVEASRIRAMQSPIIPIVGSLVRSVPGTISLGQGVVFYGPPPSAVEALSEFLADPGNHRYGPVDGMPALREALAEKLERENGIRIGEGQRVVVTAGGNMAFLNTVLATVNPGDEVILPLPYYFNQEMAVGMVGGRVVTVPTGADYQPDPARIRDAITSRTRAVVTISPNNPTGAVYPEELLREINEICRERGIYHISDEAYEYFTYDEARHFSPGSIEGSGDHTISLFSLSKAYGFASWRIGYMVIPDRLGEAIGKIQDTVLICPPVVSQYAALGALKAGVAYAKEKVGTIAEARRAVLAELREIESFCTVVPTAGAFYLLLRLHTAIDPLQLVERLVREHRVAVIPGTTFGLEEGCYLRLSYGALRPAEVEEGVGRLVEGLKAIVRA
ncbi:MAG TPA: pyridoxal phosphate-dependent aminotransferase [Longimicrobiaceae bacterium]